MNEEAMGQAARRGVLAPGDRVQITDSKGKLHTIILVPGGRFQTTRGVLHHDDLLGQPDGQVIEVGEGRTFQVIRPLLSDYVLSMPRGAAIVYPKDSAQIVQMGDIFPGARVVEAGVGSGSLSMSLLGAIGPKGKLISVELRPEFAEIAAANVDLWFGKRHPAWDLRDGDVGEVLSTLPMASIDRVVLDLLDPWSFIEPTKHALLPGGVLICYVATVPQMSRLVEDLRETGTFTEPEIWESTIRPWHAEGLAVRPEHRMVAHTGFLITARRLAQGVSPHQLGRRPAKASQGKLGAWQKQGEWTEELLGLRRQSPKKTRRVARDLQARTQNWLGK